MRVVHYENTKRIKSYLDGKLGLFDVQPRKNMLESGAKKGKTQKRKDTKRTYSTPSKCLGKLQNPNRSLECPMIYLKKSKESCGK